MRVVLLQSVSGLGEAGEVKEVSNGYGRNFLLPRGLAEFASPVLMKRAEERRNAEERRQLLASAGMADVAKTLEGLEVVIKAKIGAHDRLYGAVTSADIADEVHKLTRQDIDKRKVDLDEPIHQLGEYEVSVKLSGDLVPKLKVVVEEERVEVKLKDKAKAKEAAQEEPEAKLEDKEEAKEAAQEEPEAKD